jgi:hypothetical protein
LQEHAANTAVGLRLTPDGSAATHAVFVTADGHDGGNIYHPTSGINAHEFAHFLIDVLHVDSAMGMDQGASCCYFAKKHFVLSKLLLLGGARRRLNDNVGQGLRHRL